MTEFLFLQESIVLKFELCAYACACAGLHVHPVKTQISLHICTFLSFAHSVGSDGKSCSHYSPYVGVQWIQKTGALCLYWRNTVFALNIWTGSPELTM